MLNKACFVLIAAISVACSQSQADRSTASSGCSQKLNGNWDFGRAPYGCAMSAAVAKPLEGKYNELAYRESQAGKKEDQRYINLMHDFLVDYAKDYMKRREPKASAAQVDGWVQLVLATANQESSWTQYRYGKDNMFRFLKGDGNHGYGLMQIDNRSHKQFINSNKVYDINPHMVYALDMLYDLRKKAIKKPCSGKKDLASINRSVYSGYNGGAGSMCRWLNGGSKWAKNDKGFWQKYQNRTWEKSLVASN